MAAAENEEMKINVRVTKTVQLKVKKSDTLRKLKTNLSELEGVSSVININGLFFAGSCLENDHKSLVDYNITSGSTLSVYLHSRCTMQIYVKMSQLGKTITLDVDTSNTIIMVKQMIQNKEGILVCNQDLVYLGEQLKDTQTILSCNILNESTVYAIFPPGDAMEIFVDLNQNLGSNTISLKVKKWYTIENVKNMMESSVGIPTEKLELYFNKRMIENQATLAELRIEGGETLSMLNGVRIIVKTLPGKTLIFDVDSTYTVENLKEIIEEDEGIHVDQQRLIYNNRQLQDSSTLAECNITSDTVLHLVLRLRG